MPAKIPLVYLASAHCIMDILVARLWESAQNQTVVAWYEADPLSMVLQSSHENRGSLVTLLFLILLIITFTPSPPPIAFNLDPPHLVKISSKLDTLILFRRRQNTDNPMTRWENRVKQLQQFLSVSASSLRDHKLVWHESASKTTREKSSHCPSLLYNTWISERESGVQSVSCLPTWTSMRTLRMI